MIDTQKKVEVVRENWYKTDCKGLSASVIKDAYERGFNRSYQLLKAQKPAEISEREDQNIWQAVQRVGVDVDKDELIRALKYDRWQYEKGYADAMKNAVPLDKLCDWLAEKWDCPPERMTEEGLCKKFNRKCSKCCRQSIEKWMEGLDGGERSIP